MRISDWSSDVCSSDLHRAPRPELRLFSVALQAAAGALRIVEGLQPERRQLGELQQQRAPARAVQREIARLANDRRAVAVGDHQSLLGRDQRLREALRYREVEAVAVVERSEEHKSELQSLMRNAYAVFCLKQ